MQQLLGDSQKFSRCKATPTQLTYLAEFMKNHPDLASGLSQTLQGRVTCDALWQKLTAELNALGGPIKTVAKWKQVNNNHVYYVSMCENLFVASASLCDSSK